MHARTTPTEGCALPLLYLCTSTCRRQAGRQAAKLEQAAEFEQAAKFEQEAECPGSRASASNGRGGRGRGTSNWSPFKPG